MLRGAVVAQVDARWLNSLDEVSRRRRSNLASQVCLVCNAFHLDVLFAHFFEDFFDRSRRLVLYIEFRLSAFGNFRRGYSFIGDLNAVVCVAVDAVG